MSRGSWFPLGLDLETTGLQPEDAVILSVGAYDPDTARRFYEEIRWDKLKGTPSALRINGMDFTTLDLAENSIGQQRLRMETCDIAFTKWIKELKNPQGEAVRNYIPVGFNVGSFDVDRFMREYMPKSRAEFGHRFIDLNSLFFRESYRTNTDFMALRDRVITEATVEMGSVIETERRKAELNKWKGYNFDHHNALYDAIKSTECFKILANPDRMRGLVGLADSEGG